MAVDRVKSAQEGAQVRPPVASEAAPEMTTAGVSNRSDGGQPLGSELVWRPVTVRPRDVVYVKGIVEASRGLATLHAEGGGELLLCTTASQAAALDELLDDLGEELGLRRRREPMPGTLRAALGVDP